MDLGVDVSVDGGIDGVDGDGYVVDFECGEIVDVWVDVEVVVCEVEDYVWVVLLYEF